MYDARNIKRTIGSEYGDDRTIATVCCLGRIRMHVMWTIATDVPVAWCVCQSVRNAPARCRSSCWDRRNIVLDRGPDSPHGFDAAFPKLLCLLSIVSSGRSLQTKLASSSDCLIRRLYPASVSRRGLRDYCFSTEVS